MGYKSDSTFHDDEWDNKTTEIYLEYARKALGEPASEKDKYWEETSTKTLEFWKDTDIQQESDAFEKFEDEFVIWMKLYWDSDSE